jgi:geranylgeranyl transferase type-2 subunit alpha
MSLIFRSPQQLVGLLKTELKLTMAYLQIHPKVYWIWNHRKWCLENVPLGPGDSEEWRCGFWKGELAVIEALLDADARNCELNFVLQPDKP